MTARRQGAGRSTAVLARAATAAACAALLPLPPAVAAGQEADTASARPAQVATPDRTGPEWSRAPVPLLAIGEVQRGEAAGGASWRVGTARGAVLVWRPPGYRSSQAGLVVYLHGYFTTVDQAAADHRLAEQFRRSGRNALFIVPESPAWDGEAPVWPELGALLDEVLGRTGLTAPRGPLVVAAHSGGFRPLLAWLADPRLEEVLLLDGLYRGEERWRAWLEGAPPGARRRLVLVGDETAARGDALAAAVPGSVALAELPLPRAGLPLPRAGLPPPRPGLPAEARAARLLSIRSQLPHMAMVETGEVLPLLLAATRLPAVR
jgi:hypothetical protein